MKHGLYKSSIYGTWCRMKSRCSYKKHRLYHCYGGRGIKVCERWNKFENFLEDMGHSPSPKHSLDRIDNNGNYCKENCRWATRAQQDANTRKSIVVDFLGEKISLRHACRKVNIPHSTMDFRRIKRLGNVRAISFSDFQKLLSYERRK